MTIISIRMRSNLFITALPLVTFSHLDYMYIVNQHGCQVIQFGQKLQNIARDCIEYMLGYTVMQMRKTNRGATFQVPRAS